MDESPESAALATATPNANGSGLNEHQQFERDWWGDAANTFAEERKQIGYAQRMGLQPVAAEGKWPCYDLAGKNVLDLGGGPVSMLLKAVNLGPRCTVIDPCPYPDWIDARYAAHGITYTREAAEEVAVNVDELYDEVWIYNVLQHVQDPAAVLELARAAAPLLRLFEWVEHPASLGHPHVLHVHDLNEWIGGGANGNVEILEYEDLHGIAYHGVFALAPAVLEPVAAG